MVTGSSCLRFLLDRECCNVACLREAFGSEATSKAIEALLAAPHSACSIFEEPLCTSSSLLAFLGHFLLCSFLGIGGQVAVLRFTWGPLAT